MSWFGLSISPKGRLDLATFRKACTVLFCIWIGVAAIDIGLSRSGHAVPAFSKAAFCGIFVLFLVAANRRLHDRNRSGWWLLPVYGPIAFGVIVALFFDEVRPNMDILRVIIVGLMLPALWIIREMFFREGEQVPNIYGGPTKIP